MPDSSARKAKKDSSSSVFFPAAESAVSPAAASSIRAPSPLSHAEPSSRAEASSRARQAGAEDLHISTSRDIREANVEGRPMFIEATVTVTASGRPRVAH